MKRFAFLLPILAGILFGSVGVFVRTLNAYGLSNVSIIFIRSFFASIMLLFYIVWKDWRLLKFGWKNVPWMLLCGLVGMMGTNLTFNISSTHLSLAFAAVLLSIAPVYTVIISRFAFGDKISGKKVICIIMTICGCILVSGVLSSKIELSMIGVIAGLVSGVTYGLYSIFSKFGIGSGMKSIALTFYCLLIITCATAPFADYGMIITFACEKPVSHTCFLLLHSLCIAVLPYLMITMSLEYIDPGKVSILASCEPVAAMVFGVLFFAETPSIFAIAGLCITLIALAILCKE